MVDKILNTGVDALLGDVASPNKQSIKEIDLNKIKPNRFQPRQTFDEQKINELSQSIAKHGILSPILVRETGAGGYELIAGERRLRAAKKAGLVSAPCMVDVAEDQVELESLPVLDAIVQGRENLAHALVEGSCHACEACSADGLVVGGGLLLVTIVDADPCLASL